MEELGTKVGSCYIDVKLNTPNNNAVNNLNSSIKQKLLTKNLSAKVGINIDEKSFKKSQSILRGLSRDVRGLGGDIAGLAKIPLAGLIGTIATFKMAGDKSTESWRKYDLQLTKLKETIAELGQKMLQINIFGKTITEWTDLLTTSIKNIPVNKLESFFGLATKAMIFGKSIQFIGSSLRTIKELRGMGGDIGELIGKKSHQLPIQPTLPINTLSNFLPTALGAAAGSNYKNLNKYARRQVDAISNAFNDVNKLILEKRQSAFVKSIKYVGHVSNIPKLDVIDEHDRKIKDLSNWKDIGYSIDPNKLKKTSTRYTPPKFKPNIINTIPDVQRITTGISKGFSNKKEIDNLGYAATGLITSLLSGFKNIGSKVIPLFSKIDTMLVGITSKILAGFTLIKGFATGLIRFVPIVAGLTFAMAAIKGSVEGLVITAKDFKIAEDFKVWGTLFSASLQSLFKYTEELFKSLMSGGKSGNPLENTQSWFQRKFINEDNAGNVELVNPWEQKRIRIEMQIKETYDNLDKFTNSIYKESLSYAAGQSAPKILEKQIKYYNDWIVNKQNEANNIKQQLEKDKGLKSAGREGLSELSIKSYTDMLAKINKDIEEKRTEVESLNQEAIRKEIEIAKDKISYLDRVKDINDKIKENQEKRSNLNVDLGDAAKETLSKRYSMQIDKIKALAQTDKDYKKEVSNVTKGDTYTQKSSIAEAYDIMQRSIEKFNQDKKDIKNIQEDYDKKRFEISQDYYKKSQENSDAYYTKEEQYREELIKNDKERLRIEQERIKLEQDKEVQNKERHNKNIEVLKKLNDLITIIKTPVEGVL